MRFHVRQLLTVAFVCSDLSISPLVARAAQLVDKEPVPDFAGAPPSSKRVPTASWSDVAEDAMVPLNTPYFAGVDTTSVMFTVPTYVVSNNAINCPGPTTYPAAVWGGIGDPKASQYSNSYANPFIHQAGINLEIDCSEAGGPPSGLTTEMVYGM